VRREGLGLKGEVQLYPYDDPLSIRITALDYHVRESVDLLQAGMEYLRRINLANGCYAPTFLLLSFGYEHLMKDILCAGYYDKYGRFPTGDELKNFGHDLIKLKKTISADYTSDKYFQTPEGMAFLEILTNNPRVDRLFSILARYSNPADSRYYKMDVVIADDPIAKNKEKSAVQEWIEEELEEYKREKGPEYLQSFKVALDKDIYGTVIVPSIEIKLIRFNRALAEVLIHQGDMARRHLTNAVHDLRHEPNSHPL
jgi:hypothetical protein